MNSVILSNIPVLILYCSLFLFITLNVFFKKGRLVFSILAILLLSAFIIIAFIYEITLIELITSLLIFVIVLGALILLEKRLKR